MKKKQSAFEVREEQRKVVALIAQLGWAIVPGIRDGKWHFVGREKWSGLAVAGKSLSQAHQAIAILSKRREKP